MSRVIVRGAIILDAPLITELSEQLGYQVTEDDLRTRLENLIQLIF